MRRARKKRSAAANGGAKDAGGKRARVLGAEVIAKYCVDASALWRHVRDTKERMGEKFLALSDKHKLKLFNEHPDHAQFAKEFPIVTRTMVCMGQFNMKAFKRFLDKIDRTRRPEKVESGYDEDQWFRRRADYMRYLWEANNRAHYNEREARAVWQYTYNTLKGEMDDFRNKHDDVKKMIEIEKQTNHIASFHDIVASLEHSEHDMPRADAEDMLAHLSVLQYQHRKGKMLEQLLQRVRVTPAVCECVGERASDEETGIEFYPKLNIVDEKHAAE